MISIPTVVLFDGRETLRLCFSLRYRQLNLPKLSTILKLHMKVSCRRRLFESDGFCFSSDPVVENVCQDGCKKRVQKFTLLVTYMKQYCKSQHRNRQLRQPQYSSIPTAPYESLPIDLQAEASVGVISYEEWSQTVASGNHAMHRHQGQPTTLQNTICILGRTICKQARAFVKIYS